MNNAGPAFDETYTKYYPLMYRIWLEKRRRAQRTLDALQRALDVKTEAEGISKLEREAKNRMN